MTVMIADGILPSNEGRGYVLRRILRRAVRHGRLMGIEKPFLAPIVDIVAGIFAEPFPDLADRKEYIKKVIQLEEERFHTTLAQGLELLTGHINTLRQAEKNTLDGATGFKLYDTYGFPWELTQEILADYDMELDKTGFDLAMKEQRERARAARTDVESKVILPDLSQLATDKLSVKENAETAKLVLLAKEGNVVNEIHDGEEVLIILDVTPFHAETS